MRKPCKLVAKALDTGRGIAVEDLKGIRERMAVRKAQRRIQHSWSFHDLRFKIEYKARLAGSSVILVDPRKTSWTCPHCGSIDARNRPDQATTSVHRVASLGQPTTSLRATFLARHKSWCHT